MRFHTFYLLQNILIFLILSVIPFSSSGKVLEVQIHSRDTVMNGKSWGDAGAYELIRGVVIFATDPANPANARITDLHLAPQDNEGMVRSSADLIVLKPLDASKAKIAVLEVSNRGNKYAQGYLLGGSGGFTDLDDPAQFGDGLFMKRGATLIWVGWQFDLPESEELLNFITPTAKYPEGGPIIGLVRSDWVVDDATHELKLGHRTMKGYPVYDPASDIHTLTRRSGRYAPRIPVDRETWEFGTYEDGEIESATTHIASKEGFEPGYIYELVYHSVDPSVVGLGIAAIRDIISYAKYDEQSLFPVEHAIATGVSQSGRFLRNYLYQGFNRDEEGRKVYDGMMIVAAGAGRGSFNHRFAQPSRDGHRYSAFFYPTDIFPFASQTQPDIEGGRPDGLLYHLEPKYYPRTFYINTGYEYWGRAASLIHTTPDGLKDLHPMSNERIYHLASAQHYVDRFPPAGETTPYIGNPLSFDVTVRALAVALDDWVRNDETPPPSAFPKLSDETLVEVSAVNYPDLPRFIPSQVVHTAHQVDYGAAWARKGIITNQPPLLGAEYGVKVPQVDIYGNEAGGIRNVELLVPLATYIPYSLRSGLQGSPEELRDFKGTYLPFPLEETTEDSRPSIKTLYPDKKAYLSKVRQAVDSLVAERLVLQDDVHSLMQRASSYWNWMMEEDVRTSEPVKVLSFNIRYDNPGDGEDQWGNRKDRVVHLIDSLGLDFFGLQEALLHQVRDVQGGVKGYRWIGVGREDGLEKGEFAPLFYNRKKWKLEDEGHFWLSQTPFRPSTGWDAALPRIATWGRFAEKGENKTIYVFNTHFDHRGEQARFESVLLLKRQMREIAGDHPTLLMGDFNFGPKATPYLSMTGYDNHTIWDTRTLAKSNSGPAGTFSGFDARKPLPINQIDYIFTSDQIEVRSFKVIQYPSKGHHVSDHFPVYTEIDIH